MALEMFKMVTLQEDEYKLRRGDVATIVERHPASDEDGYSLEVFNAIGETIAVVTVAESQIKLLTANQVLHARLLEEAV
ncbi:MAG: DUF4926 domain-containing protein [Hormoscilla sp. SP5CHS1]|nr:DUF4926 domain-containing protein [Hormoscilla sp. SP12CHS1]MBC6456262.1 DUF4926 domain-containing protein [Hormoscilla sp. SP5CHS1]